MQLSGLFFILLCVCCINSAEIVFVNDNPETTPLDEYGMTNEPQTTELLDELLTSTAVYSFQLTTPAPEYHTSGANTMFIAASVPLTLPSPQSGHQSASVRNHMRKSSLFAVVSISKIAMAFLMSSVCVCMIINNTM